MAVHEIRLSFTEYRISGLASAAVIGLLTQGAKSGCSRVHSGLATWGASPETMYAASAKSMARISRT